jgi:hypothetical protein
MSIITRPRWSLGRGKTVVPSSWQATPGWPWGGETKQILVVVRGRVVAARGRPTVASNQRSYSHDTATGSDNSEHRRTATAL